MIIVRDRDQWDAGGDVSAKVVEEIFNTGNWVLVYNLRIADYHTYFVGCDEWGFSVWTHNTDLNGDCACAIQKVLGPSGTITFNCGYIASDVYDILKTHGYDPVTIKIEDPHVVNSKPPQFGVEPPQLGLAPPYHSGRDWKDPVSGKLFAQTGFHMFTFDHKTSKVYDQLTGIEGQKIKEYQNRLLGAINSAQVAAGEKALEHREVFINKDPQWWHVIKGSLTATK